MERDEIVTFKKMGTKLGQKLKYRDQIKNEEMTPGIIVIHDTITTTSHYHCHVTQCQLDNW